VSWVDQLARPDIVALKAYQPAAWEPGLTRLHANEVPWRAAGDESNAGLNHYPEPQPRELVGRLAEVYGVARASVLVTRGSDEAIDLLVRAFCRAGQDAVLVCSPTFGMYAVAAQIQGARLIDVPLREPDGFALDPDALIERCTPAVKLVFLCSPNNPTGNLLSECAILRVLEHLHGRALVVVDEAYVEFSARRSLAALIPQRPHLAVLRTLSKAHGLAGARLGTLIADLEVIALVQKLIAPYAIPRPTLETVLVALRPSHLKKQHQRLSQLCDERRRMREGLATLRGVTQVYPTDANFLLTRFKDPAAALVRARAAQLLVRDVRGYAGLEDALRVTIGTPAQNQQLLRAWR
jgi:histidinol-phosphate aminotransferase